MHPTPKDLRQAATLHASPASALPPPRPCAQATLDSQALLQSGKAVVIRHNGKLYRLQTTRQGKLILTK
ncbi:MAG: hemin uptake protein HemP [Curvibacter sp.]|jgi:hemin uptake protein HemP|nr:hemin uptake protein HemP [Curvibacter sp.]